METNRSIRWNKVGAFYAKVWFYSVLIPCVLLVFRLVSFEVGLLKIVFPVLTNQYWFASIYIFLLLLLPFLNTMFQNLTDKQLGLFLLIVFAFSSVQPMFFHNAIGESGYGITHAVLMISLGYYIKRKQMKLSKLKCFLIGAIAIAVGAGINLAWLILTGERNKIITDYNSPFIILAACMVFMFFLSINPKGKKIFSKLAPNVFAVYLVNDNPYMRSLIYSLLGCDKYYNSPYMIIHYIVVCLIFFVVAIIIDIFYEKIYSLLFRRKEKEHNA